MTSREKYNIFFLWDEGVTNAMNFLKLDSGDWVSSREGIGGNFISHFTNLFTSLNTLIEKEMLDLFSPVISD
jgi:hypothetical protein